jgi:uncharacterized protein with HEPN domain
MAEADLVRLRHMKEVIAFASGETRASLGKDRKLALAIVKDVEIIGEAASKVSEETRERHPGIAWRPIIAMRNRLIHAYFEIDFDQVWSAVTEDLPPLIAELEQALRAEGVNPDIAFRPKTL